MRDTHVCRCRADRSPVDDALVGLIVMVYAYVIPWAIP